jgi:predicted ArsR family transcriptional regulator
MMEAGLVGLEVAGREVAGREVAGRDAVAASLVTEGPATAAMLGRRLGISGTAVRRHLDALVADGLVASTERPPYGRSPVRRRGRPARTFVITDAGRSQFRSEYDTLAAQALAFLASTAGDDAVAAFAQARASQLEQALRDLLGDDWQQQPVERKLEGLAQALSELGFSASTEPARAGTQMCQHHCPVSHVAQQYPQLCEAETEAFARLLGHHVQRLATIAHGDGVCTTVVPLTLSERTSA